MHEIQKFIVYMLRGIEVMGYATRDAMAKKYVNQFTTNCMGFVSLTILLWDHIVTFDDEVEYVWNGNKGPFKYLFLLNRYLIPLGFSINIFAYLSPALSNEVPGSVSAERCRTFIRFEGSMTVIGINIVAIMMFFRVYALYRAPWLASMRRYVYILAGVLVLELGMNAWLLTKGVPSSDGRGCEMIFNGEIPKAVTSSSAWLPLLYDTLAFVLIFRATFEKKKPKEKKPGNITLNDGIYLCHQILQDGLLYYCPILVVTLSLSLMIAFAPPGFQNIIAQLELVITVTMMSRISINLKKPPRKEKDIGTELSDLSNFVVRHPRAQMPSPVQDLTRSRIQNEHDGDLEMVIRNHNSEPSTDSDIECGRQWKD